MSHAKSHLASFFSYFALVAIGVTIGCASTDDTPSRDRGPGSRPASSDLDDTAAARLYQRKCSTCHAAPVIAHFDDAEWRSIMPGMAREARLSRNETRDLTDYVLKVNGKD